MKIKRLPTIFLAASLPFSFLIPSLRGQSKGPTQGHIAEAFNVKRLINWSPLKFFLAKNFGESLKLA